MKGLKVRKEGKGSRGEDEKKIGRGKDEGLEVWKGWTVEGRDRAKMERDEDEGLRVKKEGEDERERR